MITLTSLGPLSLDLNLHAPLPEDTISGLEAAAPDDPVVWQLSNCRIHTTAGVMLAWLTLGQMNHDAVPE